jgi:calcineurin-like phosphoesterase family protein
MGSRLLEELRAIVPPAERIYEAPKDAEGTGKRHVHVLMLSDLHAGEIVDQEAMNGLNEFSFHILTQRMKRIHKSLVSFQNNRPYPIDELRIWCLGDLVGGQHHEELAQTNELGVIQQTHQTGLLLGGFIEGLTEHYPRIYVTGIAGNHGRINRKPQAKQVFEAFDWLAMETAKLYLRNYPTVSCSFPLSGMTIDKVAGKTVLLGHGDGIRSTMPGVPWGGVIRRWNELRKTYAQVGTPPDYFALGHFHQAAVVRGIFMNGSVKGPDEWVLKQYGTADPPEQLLLTFCKDTQRLTDVSYITP